MMKQVCKYDAYCRFQDTNKTAYCCDPNRKCEHKKDMFTLVCGNCQTEFMIVSDLKDSLQWRTENRAFPPYPRDNQFWCPICDYLCSKKG